MKACLGILLALALIFGIGSTGSAELIFNDHFNDNSLNPAWAVTFKNATGWNYAEAGTELTVTGISSTSQDTGSGGNWAEANMSTSFAPLTDFTIGFGFSWDSKNSFNAMQYVGIELYDNSNVLISKALYCDAWVDSTGMKYSTAGGESYASGYDSLEWSGSAVIDIIRVGGGIDIKFNNASLLSGTNTNLLGGVNLGFGYYDYNGHAKSLFGSFAVDFVSVDGTPYASRLADLSADTDGPTAAPVPEPATIMLLGIGLIGLAGYGRKRFK